MPESVAPFLPLAIAGTSLLWCGAFLDGANADSAASLSPVSSAATSCMVLLLLLQLLLFASVCVAQSWFRYLGGHTVQCPMQLSHLLR